jgi:hypothetical protein
MYNGNGSTNGNGGSSGSGGFSIKPIYLYIAGAVAVVLVLLLVMQFLNTSLVVHFGALAGVLLIIGNLRELIGQGYGRQSSTALLNVLIAGGLIFAWLSQFFGAWLWAPALLLLGGATPLVLGRASVYTTYVDMARRAADGVRRTIVR